MMVMLLELENSTVLSMYPWCFWSKFRVVRPLLDDGDGAGVGGVEGSGHEERSIGDGDGGGTGGTVEAVDDDDLSLIKNSSCCSRSRSPFGPSNQTCAKC